MKHFWSRLKGRVTRDDRAAADQTLAERGPADLVLALGLMHHLTLSNHVPFPPTALPGDDAHRLGFDAANYRWQDLGHREDASAICSGFGTRSMSMRTWKERRRRHTGRTRAESQR